MRIFSFNNGRYVDLDHIQEISRLHYSAVAAHMAKDENDVSKAASGYAMFTYRLAFSEKLGMMEISFPASRVFSLPFEKVDAFEVLEAFKAEYERFLASWIDWKNSSKPLEIAK